MAEAGDLNSPESGFESQSGHMRPNSIVVVLLAVGLAGCASAAPTAEVTSVRLEAGPGDFVAVVAEGLVHGLAESGGTCRFIFWADNGAASQLTGRGEPVGGAVRCGPVSEQAGRILPSGHYEVELRYDGPGRSLRSPRLSVDLG